MFDLRRSLGIFAAIFACAVPTDTGHAETATALPQASLVSSAAAPDTLCTGGPRGSAPQLCATLPDTLALGQRVTVSTLVYDAIGRAVPKPRGRVFLACAGPEFVQAANDRLTGRLVGFTLCRAIWDRSDGNRMTVERLVTVRGAATPPPPDSMPVDTAVVPPPDTTTAPPPPDSTAPVPVATRTVALALVRFDGATGAASVATGIPLPPAWLRPEDGARVWVVVNGAPVAIHAAPLAGRHPDGSVRALLVAGTFPPGAAQLVIADSARPAPLVLTASSAPAPASVPAAAILPTDPAYLLATELDIGSMTSAAASRALGPAFAAYEDLLTTHLERAWTRDGADWAVGNYYDRGQTWRARWVQTGNPVFWHRANRQVVDYRDRYLVPNNHLVSAHWSMYPGLLSHYLSTGDEASRTALGALAANILPMLENGTDWYLNGPTREQILNASQMENRIAARILQGSLLAARIDAPSSLNWGGGRILPWFDKARTAVERILAIQDSDGGIRHAYLCRGSLPFMDGLLAEQMIEAYRVLGDERIPPFLERLADYTWTHWHAPSKSFYYFNGPTIPCVSSGENIASSADPAPDLSMMLAPLHAWRAARTGRPEHRARVVQIVEGAVAGGSFYLPKQLNQLSSGVRALGWLVR